MSDVVYEGNAFSVDRAGDEWAIWRFRDGDGRFERLNLTTDAMDELRDYFADFYAVDKEET